MLAELAKKNRLDAINFAKELIKNYDEQENWSTAKPLYYKVQYQKDFLTYDEETATSFTCRDQHGNYDNLPICKLEEYQENRLYEVLGFYETKWTDDPQSGLFFTRKGAEDYLAVNKHNIPGPTRFYIGHFFRNDEMKKVIGALRCLAKEA